MSAVYQAHATLLGLSVCGGVKGVWVGDVFVFPVEEKAQFYTVCSGWMYSTDVNNTLVYGCQRH